MQYLCSLPANVVQLLRDRLPPGEERRNHEADMRIGPGGKASFSVFETDQRTEFEAHLSRPVGASNPVPQGEKNLHPPRWGLPGHRPDRQPGRVLAALPSLLRLRCRAPECTGAGESATYAARKFQESILEHLRHTKRRRR